MFSRANLLIVVVAIVGAALGLLVGKHFDGGQPARRDVVLLERGDALPDLALPDMSGTVHRLSEWHGSLVLLNFWAPWCNPCRTEMPLFNAANEKNGLRVVTVAVDDPDEVRDYLKDNPVSFPVLLADPQRNPSLDFGNAQDAYPYSLLVGRDGKIIAQKVGGFEPAQFKEWLSKNLPSND